jgi:hypothetical protein
MKFHRVLLRMMLSIAALCTMSWGQNTASITGTVKDPSGASIPNAAVVVSNLEHGITRETVTNSGGDYSEAALPAGSYDVTVTATGFKKYAAKGVVLNVADKARVDVSLEVGAASTEVTVQGADVAQVETQSSDLAGTVNGKEISQLELNGRNFTQLVTLVPGVSNQTGQDEGTVGVYGNVSFSMNGGRVEYNNWELDGGDNMDNGSNSTLNVYPSVDAIAEFKVLTSNYGAQYGRNGSGTVEVETKSGTNKFHGDVYEFVRNDAFNAKNYFDSSVPPYKKNDYGYTVGGPVYIPGVYNKDKTKTFFFWSEEWRKERVPSNFNQAVPSAAERTGDFSDLCPNPTTGDNSDCPVVPGFTNGAGFTPNLNVVPGFNASDPNVQALLPMIPLPTQGVPGAEFYNVASVQPTDWREELFRVDHNLSANERVTFRFIHDSWNTITSTPLWTNAGSFPTIQTAFKGPGVSLVGRLTSTFSPTLLNEFVFSYTTDHIILNDVGAWQRPTSMTIGDLFGGNGHGVLPGINLVGGNAYGGGFGQDAGYIPNGIYNSNPTYTYRDNLNKIIGKHNLTMGLYMAFAQKNELGGELGAGSVNGYLTFDSSNTQVTSGNPFADLLLGNISSFGQQDRFVKYFNRYKLVEPYFQDDWRVTDRLTLNLGIRLSLYGTYREKQHQAFNFDPSRYVVGQTTVAADGTVSFLTADNGTPSVSDLPNGIVQCGVTSGVPAGCMKGHLFNPAPRIGFAWDPFGNGKWAIRGGYGVFFEHTNGNEGNTESLENSPPLANAVQQNNISGYTQVGVSVGTSSQLPLNVNAIPTKAIWPYIQQWHLDVQHEVLRNTVVTMSYVGSKGTHLTRQTDYNQLPGLPLSQNPYAPGEALDPSNTDCNALTVNGNAVTGQAAINLAVACGANPDGFRPFLGYGNITRLQPAASSIYHAFQMSVRRTMGGLTLSGAYTFSHSIDDSSDRGDGSFVDSFNPASNRASSNFDQRHILNISYVWDLPFFKGKGVAHNVLGGWEYSGITSFSTGTPFSATFADVSDNAGVANGVGTSSRPDLVGDPNSSFTQVQVQGLGPQFYNPAAFAAPRGLTFGTAGRNILRNPHRINFDMALFKHFAITERLGFEFRAEAFNIFNHTQWGGIAGDSGSAGGAGNNSFPSDNFAYVSSAHNPRILQLGAKFIF